MRDITEETIAASAEDIRLALQPHEAIRLNLSRERGPNNWDTIVPEDFGPTWDFELENHISLWIITPTSEAAKQWLYAHLPEDAPRWGALGYVVEARYLEPIVEHMRQDNLMTPEDYERAMNESHEQALQGEER